MAAIPERTAWQAGDGKPAQTLLETEWLVTNGLGGYASGTILGAVTRRYHGMLIAALPDPMGRTMMFNHLSEQIRLPDGQVRRLWGRESVGGLDRHGAEHLRSFRLELGLPVWEYKVGPVIIEKRLFMPHLQNSTFLQYRILSDETGEGVRLSLRPSFHFRPHDAPVTSNTPESYQLRAREDQLEVWCTGKLPPLRMRLSGEGGVFIHDPGLVQAVLYRMEAARGYEAEGELYALGHFKAHLRGDHPVTLVASSEPWETVVALTPNMALEYEHERRRRLISLCAGADRDPTLGELAIAADQFVVAPLGRVASATRARAAGDELRTVIAGYHWFTDWGRDTMISLEGLTLATGRHDEARWILHNFARQVRNGLIPNLVPEGSSEGLYHTADATLWFFHAVDRYLAHTKDFATVERLIPVFQSIVDWHQRGTAFGIHVDPQDGLLVQGQKGYQLTWMDAKCDGWVVTPRRGKAVELNALWYNALSVLGAWVGRSADPERAKEYRDLAARVQDSFNRRFWYEAGGYLFDVVDGQDEHDGDEVRSPGHRRHEDASLRPNQVFAISLQNPVLTPSRWAPVMEILARELLTPVGLRSLSADHLDYKPNYHGDLRTRDAAYHQGTVWSWLIGPFVDAWRKTFPQKTNQCRDLIGGLEAHLGEACVGNVSEIFDAQPPFTARGCIAQAWGVAEFLRVRQQLLTGH